MSASSLSLPIFLRINFLISYLDSNRLTEHNRLTHTESFAEWQKAGAGCTSRAFKHPGHDVTCTWRLAVNFDWLHIYIYAFNRRFYPKRLTIAFRLYIFISICVPWESNPQPFALLTQCSTTEPHRNTYYTYDSELDNADGVPHSVSTQLDVPGGEQQFRMQHRQSLRWLLTFTLPA